MRRRRLRHCIALRSVEIGCLMMRNGCNRITVRMACKRGPAKATSVWRFIQQFCFSAAIIGAAPLQCASLPSRSPDEVIDIGKRRELFADGFLVDQLKGKAELRLHHPVPQEIALTHDSPWEGNHTLNYNVFKEGNRYRMFYSTTQLTITAGGKSRRGAAFCCYAESMDGITWRKPELGQIEFRGSKANNIVFASGQIGNWRIEPAAQSVVRDENPNATADARYKAFVLGLVPDDSIRGLLALKSADGIRWQPMEDHPILTDGSFDAQNIVYWDALRSEYRAYWRYYIGVGDTLNRFRGVRSLRTATSKDLQHWERQADLNYRGSPLQHLYSSQVQPYYRAPHLFIGFPTRYIERELKEGSLEDATEPAGPERTRQWSPSMRALPDLEDRELRAAVRERFGTGVTDALFMAARDGANFKRWNESFIRPGIERTGTWNAGQNNVAWRLVETASPLEGAPNELSFYVSESYWTGTSSVLRRFSLRLDGFVSAAAPLSGGELITKPLRFRGAKLMLNFSTSAAGSVRVEIQDANGAVLPGFSRHDCASIFGDTLERQVSWGEADLKTLADAPIRLCFILNDADVFSFKFED
jgi:hypothetical protein